MASDGGATASPAGNKASGGGGGAEALSSPMVASVNSNSSSSTTASPFEMSSVSGDAYQMTSVVTTVRSVESLLSMPSISVTSSESVSRATNSSDETNKRLTSSQTAPTAGPVVSSDTGTSSSTSRPTSMTNLPSLDIVGWLEMRIEAQLNRSTEHFEARATKLLETNATLAWLEEHSGILYAAFLILVSGLVSLLLWIFEKLLDVSLRRGVCVGGSALMWFAF